MAYVTMVHLWRKDYNESIYPVMLYLDRPPGMQGQNAVNSGAWD